MANNSPTAQKNRPDFEIVAYKQMKPFWQIVDDCYRGTHQIRAMGQKYLPKEPAEDIDSYKDRLARSVFFNAFRRTVHGLVGMVMKKKPTLSADVPEDIKGHLENCDLAGTHWSVFLQRAFTNAVKDGHSFIVVDMPSEVTREDGEALSKADEEVLGRRPFWINYTAPQAINWRLKTENGAVRIDQITFKETTTEEDGDFGEKIVTRFRVLRPGAWQLWKATTNKDGVVRKMDVEDQGVTTLKEVPVAVIYGTYDEMLVSTPPLLDLADINIEHYQLRSDLRHTMHTANVPILWVRGRKDNAPMQAIGSSIMIELAGGVDAAMGYAEHQGKAIGKSQEEIDRDERRMAVLGLDMLQGKTPQGGDDTATGRILDAAQQTSELATMAESLHDAAESSLKFHALFLKKGEDAGGSVDLHVEYERIVLDAQKIAAYKEMVAERQLPLEIFWDMLIAADELPEDFDKEKAMEMLFGPAGVDVPAVERDAQAAADAASQMQDAMGGPAPGDDEEGDGGEEDPEEEDPQPSPPAKKKTARKIPAAGKKGVSDERAK